MTEVTIDQFLVRCQERPTYTADVRWRGLGMWVRKCISKRRGADFEIAMVISNNPGSGDFTAFLDEYETYYRIFVENVHNPRLAAMLERRGYTLVDEGDAFFGIESCKHYLSPEMEYADTIPEQTQPQTSNVGGSIQSFSQDGGREEQ